MPMLTDPAQQSTNRTASRSELSRNWRVKIDATPTAGNNAATRTPCLPSQPDYCQQRDFRSRREGKKETKPEEPCEGGTLRGEDDPDTLQAIAEGRRLYVGNMPYMAKTKDVQLLFAEADFHIEHINMSVDPYTGRNPSYCFVELATKERAEQALLELNGKDLLGRPVKIGPGVARSRNKRAREESDQRTRDARKNTRPVFDRWVRTDAPDHWTGYTEQGRRLFVGGLPRMPDHHTVNADVRMLFKGYNMCVLLFLLAASPYHQSCQSEAVSKVIIPRTPAFGDASAWNHRYLFVDFATAEEASRAAKAMNDRLAWGVRIRVQPSRLADSRKLGEREAWDQEHLTFSGEAQH